MDDSLDRPDGVQQNVLTLGRWLTSQGHEVHYLTSTTTRTDLPNVHSLTRNVSVRFNGNRLSTPLWPRRGDLDDVLALGLDVLHVQMPYSPFLAGRVISRAPRSTAVLVTFHILPLSRAARAGTYALGAVQRTQVRRLDGVLAVSAAAEEFMHGAFGVPGDVVPNPVELAPFQAARSAALAVEADTSRPRVVFLGRLVERKGAGSLLDALGVLARERALSPGIEVVVAGTGPERERLGRVAVAQGLEGVVTFPGFVAEEDKPALLASADVVALPSLGGESFGISVVEALASARGVVLAGDNPGYRSVMDGLTDQLVDPRDPDAFARSLATWLADAEARRTASVRQAAAAEKFDVAVVGQAVLGHYATALRHADLRVGRDHGSAAGRRG
ncbi:glycosyltransferase family 4 protein [Cellulomonas sp. P22]|uniref:glycosyltransferase family 4 protein n=1 Tax=Cellulomonas sp. P22 TaxID=3373189 RepID=UPI003792E550